MDKGRRTVLLIAAIFIAPVVASYFAFYFLPDLRKMNYGQLLTPPVQGRVSGSGEGGSRFELEDLRGKWVYAVVDAGGCDERCQRELYATRQVRKMQGDGELRIKRVLLVVGRAALSDELRRVHPDLAVVEVEASAVAWMPGEPQHDRIYLFDPLGNLILLYPSDPDIRRMGNDMQRLLKASRIG
jgi:hypothetical protein